MSFWNDYRGIDYEGELHLDDIEFNSSLRFLFGLNITKDDRAGGRPLKPLRFERLCNHSTRQFVPSFC